MKKLVVIFVLGFMTLSFGTFAQIKVDSNGNVGIKTTGTLTRNLTVNGEVQITSTSTPDWASAFMTTVSSKDASAYDLHSNYYNQDVFYVVGEGYLWCRLGSYTGSDINMKEDIKDIASPLNLVTQLHGVTYKYKDDKEADKTKLNKRMGLIAQEVEKIVPEVVKEMKDGSKAIAYNDLIGLLVEGMKEQQTQIEELKSQITSIEENCCKTIMKSASIATEITNNINITEGKAQLNQNVPNPFSKETKIGFFIPEGSNSSVLYIYNMQGTQLQQYNINNKGDQEVIINGNSFVPGMYLYSLIVDSKEIDTKRMILTN